MSLGVDVYLHLPVNRGTRYVLVNEVERLVDVEGWERGALVNIEVGKSGDFCAKNKDQLRGN